MSYYLFFLNNPTNPLIFSSMDFYTPLRFLQAVNEHERNLKDFLYNIRLVINYIKNLIFDKKI